ncbi:hypothetical protein V6C32_17485 [Desulforamulus ruminis]|uniref:HMA2 domain-containing protein n=1 Tax=Desulforamulus ruminis TaxID=1564 RepID=UPI002FDB530B
MSGKGYEIRHTLPGRLRLEIKGTCGLNSIGAKLERLPGVALVRINPVIKTLLICYDPQQIDQRTILRNIPALPPVLNHGFKSGMDVNKKDLFWSLLAGASLLVAHASRRTVTQAGAAGNGVHYLEYLAAGITGYAVLTHRDVVNCGNRSLHLDTLAGLFSILSLESDRALMGMFVTWLLNFIEIVFGWPQYNTKCATLTN